MKKLLPILGLSILAITAMSFAWPNSEETAAQDEIKWYTWEEAVELQDNKPKKVFIDMYTDWCGWCKRMDATTFKDPEVVKYMNEHFYPVKFDAEQKEEIVFQGHTFKFINQGRKGVHELAATLLDGRLGYPSFVYLDESFQRITISPGYKPADKIIVELKYIAGEHYKDTSFQDFQAGSK